MQPGVSILLGYRSGQQVSTRITEAAACDRGAESVWFPSRPAGAQVFAPLLARKEETSSFGTFMLLS